MKFVILLAGVLWSGISSIVEGAQETITFLRSKVRFCQILLLEFGVGCCLLV